jgi:endonuclease/exonuclease/phosphatase family metal-dependent hydrolase
MAHDEPRKTQTVRIATYNIHRGRGLDGRTRLERIAAVLATIDADIVALQEVVGASPLKPGQAAELGAALGMGWVMAPTRRSSATWSSAASRSAITTTTT